MIKRIFALILIQALLFCACSSIVETEKSTTTDTSIANDINFNESSVTASDESIHSELFLSEYSTEQITEFFEEIVLNMEYSDGSGNTSLVQKWKTPINYQIYGNPTDKDLSVLSELFEQLNEILGFPGIHEATDSNLANLTISFLDYKDFENTFSSFLNGEDAFGAAQFWYYTDTNEIHTATVGYRTDIDQTTRNSVLIEEIINLLGLSDTVLREDSIVYQYSDSNTSLSDVDLVILKLMYNPAIQCGMNADTCNAVIKKLYY